MDVKLIQDALLDWKTERYARLYQYYKGQHDILNRVQEDIYKPNNRLVHNFAKYVVDVYVGYLVGIPVVYSVPPDEQGTANQDFIDKLNWTMDYNDEADFNNDVAKGMGIYGRMHEFLYVDEHHVTKDPIVRLAVSPPTTSYIHYTEELNPQIDWAARQYKKGDDYYLDIYTSEAVLTYLKKDGVLTLTDEKEHFFNDVPVIDYHNNSEMMGDFETIMTLIDAYNNMGSDSVNDQEAFTDSLLAITGALDTDSEDVGDMKRNRVLLLDSGEKAEWLVRNVNDTAEENRKQRLQNDIHRFTFVPDLTDENFSSNLSGIAIAYKLWGMEQATAIKERKMKKGLQRRIELICNIFATQGMAYDYSQVTIRFTRNMPVNEKELVELLMSLKGILSDDTIRELLPMIDDPELEKQRIEEQRDSIPYPEINTFMNTDDGDDQGGV